jgi:hypothetical protein
MAVQRPAPVTVIAILMFVFGGLGLVCSLFAMGAQSLSANMFGGQQPGMPKQVSQEELEKRMDERLPVPSKTFQTIDALRGVAMGALMIISGIGLIQVRPWGRTLAIVYAWLSLALGVASIVYTAVFVIPATQDMMDFMFQQMAQEAKTPQEQAAFNQVRAMMGMMTPVLYGSLIFAIAFLAYPIIVLVVMNMKRVKAAFSGQAIEVYDQDMPQTYEEREERWER